MELFETEMLRFHPPQTERGFYRRRRSRYGCRSARNAMPAQPLAVAVRLALATLPALSAQPTEGEAGHAPVAA
jgi:hypothetical protein